MGEQIYREQGKPSPEQVICPSCKQPVALEAAPTATCSHCEHRFDVASATTLVEYNATQNLALVLKDNSSTGRSDAATRWAVTGIVLGGTIVGSIVFGMAGFAVAGLASLGLVVAASFRT